MHDSPYFKSLIEQTARAGFNMQEVSADKSFGEQLRSKTQTAQVNEALCKVLCHNLCVVIQSMYELNVAPEFWSEAA